MTLLKSSLRAAAFLVVASANARAQATPMPTSQPAMLTIYRERVKIGHESAHAKTELAWPAALSAAKAPDTYLAMASMTGPAEVWFVTPRASYGAWGKSMEWMEANSRLEAKLDSAWIRDAAHLDWSDQIEAVAVPDLAHGTFPDLNKQRFWEITFFQLKPGHDEKFMEAAKIYSAVAKRAAPSLSWRIYSVTAGMPGGTYMIFSSVGAFGDFDKMMADGMGMMAKATPAEKAVLDKFGLESLASTITNRFRLDAKMSYVSPETKATDPAFWNKK